MQAFIKALSVYIPERIITNEMIAEEFPEWSVKKIAEKVGINQRHVASEGECASDMAFCAAERLFEENHTDKSEIDYLLFCTESPDYLLPATACILQHKLNLSTSCAALDVNLGCSGFVYGLSLAKALVVSGIAQNVLLLTGETCSKYTHPKDKGNKTIIGDAASATLISTEGFGEIRHFVLGTDGSGAENMILKTRGARNPLLKNDVCFDKYGNPISSDHFYMNGSEVFNFALSTIPDVIKKVLIKNKMNKSDISLFILHQANKHMLDYIREMADIEEEKFYLYMSEIGNTGSSTVPICLYKIIKEKSHAGNMLIAAFGGGYSFGGCALNINY
jgi:3-oxoacyl-[acyl-carrier-protein] synthase-3